MKSTYYSLDPDGDDGAVANYDDNDDYIDNAVMMMMMMTMMMTNHLNKVNHLAISVAFLQHLNCHSDRLSDNDKYDDDDNVT